MTALKTLFLEELADRYDSEKQLVIAIPKLAKLATCEALQERLHAHLKETEGHVKKLETVFRFFDAKVKAKSCEATLGLLKEGEEVAADFKGSPAINAALVSAAQKIEHYEIASYGCLHEWAKLLGNTQAAKVLEEILKEEETANASLIELARACCNKEALGECHKGDSCSEPKESKATNAELAARSLKSSQPRPALVEH